MMENRPSVRDFRFAVQNSEHFQLFFCIHFLRHFRVGKVIDCFIRIDSSPTTPRVRQSGSERECRLEHCCRSRCCCFEWLRDEFVAAVAQRACLISSEFLLDGHVAGHGQSRGQATRPEEILVDGPADGPHFVRHECNALFGRQSTPRLLHFFRRFFFFFSVSHFCRDRFGKVRR